MREASIFICILLELFAFSAEAGVRVANAPILFQGIDEVALKSICLSDYGLTSFEQYMHCKPNIDEYAGEKIIHREKNKKMYSYVEYDSSSGRVVSMRFVVDGLAYERVKDVLISKYGSPQFDSSTGSTPYWYGDKDGESFIYLEKNDCGLWDGGDCTKTAGITIITSAMRKARNISDARKERERVERKAQAIRGL